MKYPAIHTNYIISHCTTLQYNHNYMTRYLGRNEILNTKNNELVLPYFQFGLNYQCFSAARLTSPAYVEDRKLETRSV